MNTQKTLPFDAWCTGRMNKTSPKPEKPDEKSQTGWKIETKSKSSEPSAPMNNYENVQTRDRNNQKCESSNPPEKPDEKFQTGWKTELNYPYPTNNDENVQTGGKTKRKHRSSKYIKLNLQVN